MYRFSLFNRTCAPIRAARTSEYRLAISASYRDGGLCRFARTTSSFENDLQSISEPFCKDLLGASGSA